MPATRTGGRQTKTSIDDDLDDDAEEAPARRSVVRVAAVDIEQDEDPGYLDVDVIEEASGALPVGASARAGTEAESQTDELALDFGETADEEPAAEEAEDADEPQQEREPELDGSDDEYEYVADSSGLEAPSDTELQLADSLSARAQAPARVEDRRGGQRPQVQVPQADVDRHGDCWWSPRSSRHTR